MSLLGVVLRRGGLIAALVLGACPALANAHLSWSQPVFLNAGQPAAMAAPACPSSRQCTTVDNEGKEVTFNPTKPRQWEAFTVDPTGLDAVSCPTVSECVAVDTSGNQVSFDPERPGTSHLARIDRGRLLESISCPSASQCTADDSSGHVITFNPLVPGGVMTRSLSAAELYGISCPTVSQCTLIDTGSSPSGISVGQPRLLTFDPVVPTSAPGQISMTGLGSELNCPDATECVVNVLPAGCETFCGGTATFNPTSTQTPVAVSRSKFLYLSLACSSSDQCSAMDLSGQEVTFDPAATGSLSQAHIDSVGDFPKGENRGEIACASDSLCAVVSASPAGSEAMTFNPQNPRTPSIARVDDGAPAVALSCPSSTECITLARLTDFYLPGPAGSSTPLDPRTGSSGSGRWPFGGDPAGLSCPTKRQCTMVTKRSRGCSGCISGGEEWTYDPLGRVRDTFRRGQRLVPGSLSSVACPSGTECVAIGAGGRAITFNPRRPRDRSSYRLTTKALTSIACRSPRQCVVTVGVGRAVAFDPLAPKAVARFPIDGQRLLTSLSCPSAKQCTAVDAVGFEITFNPVMGTGIERRRVARQRLTAVSCPSDTRCVATSTTRTFAGNPRRGRWAQSTPLGATGLAAIACPPRGRCVVVDAAGHAYISRS